MSWEIFKQNILRVANSPEGISDINVIAELYAKEYDSAVKRGFDRQHSIPLINGNVEVMKQLFAAALQKGVNSPTPYDLVGEMGAGVKAYWAGAVMATAPLPITPAIQATVNLSVTQNIVTDPGIWQSPQSSLNVDVSEELTPEKRIEYQEALEVELEKYNKFIAQNEILKATTVLDAINKFTGILGENKDYNVEVPFQQAILGIVPGVSISTTPTTPTTPTPTTPTIPTPTTPTTPTPTIPVSEPNIDLGFFELDSGTTITVAESDDEFGEIKFNQGKPFVSGFRGGGGEAGGGAGGGGVAVDFGDLDLSADWITISTVLIGKSEGFTERATWDVNAYRCGFGTSKIVGSDGVLRDVLPTPAYHTQTGEKTPANGDVTTLDAALKLLKYQITTTFKNKIVGKESYQIPQTTFDALNDRQKSALISYVYNVGSLRVGIATALKAGNLAAAAAGIREGPVTPEIYRKGLTKRRNEEATLFST